MKRSEQSQRLEDIELAPDAMERLEGAIKHAARQPLPAKGARRVPPAKPKLRAAIRRRP